MVHELGGTPWNIDDTACSQGSAGGERGLIWQLPEQPYPSNYPSRLRH